MNSPTSLSRPMVHQRSVWEVTSTRGVLKMGPKDGESRGRNPPLRFTLQVLRVFGKFSVREKTHTQKNHKDERWRMKTGCKTKTQPTVLGTLSRFWSLTLKTDWVLENVRLISAKNANEDSVQVFVYWQLWVHDYSVILVQTSTHTCCLYINRMSAVLSSTKRTMWFNVPTLMVKCTGALIEKIQSAEAGLRHLRRSGNKGHENQCSTRVQTSFLTQDPESRAVWGRAARYI